MSKILLWVIQLVLILALVGMVQPIRVVASSLVADPPLSTLPEMTGMANLWYTSTPHEFLDSNWYVVGVRLLDVSGTIELDREVRDFKNGLQAMETTQLTDGPLLLWEGMPTVLDMVFVNQGDTVVSGTAAILGQEPVGTSERGRWCLGIRICVI